MTYSLCPHLVQEYFERVSDILTTYRPQILKQVEYDKISENLVLRGAVRPEEHERISQCGDTEGQVSQMLVVIQNRMWGFENLLAVFMEEHMSPWLIQEMFRAYHEYLVTPLKKQREKRNCQCVRIPSSILYKKWVQTLKSLDAWILKTGTLLGFVNQTLYPTTDNMLAFLSDKLADYTGGDSISSDRDDLVAYGFTPNASGEVQVAELEEDDINDLISLSETLCIGYPSTSDDDSQRRPLLSSLLDESVPADRKASSSSFHEMNKSTDDAAESKSRPTLAKPVRRKAIDNTVRKLSEGDIPISTTLKNRRSSNDTIPSPIETASEKQSKQRDLIDRLSTPKSRNAPVRLRSIPAEDNSKTKQRPKSMEFHRSMSASPNSTMASSVSTYSNDGNPKPNAEKNASKSGKATGFVRSKIISLASPKMKTKVSTNAKPTAVAKPTVKVAQGKVRQDKTDAKEDKQNSKQKGEMKIDSKDEQFVFDNKMPVEEDDMSIICEPLRFSDDEDELSTTFPKLSPEMSIAFLCNSGLSHEEEKAKSLGYYQLNFGDFQDN